MKLRGRRGKERKMVTCSLGVTEEHNLLLPSGLLVRPTKHFTTEIHDFDFDLWLASQTASKVVKAG